MNPEPTAWMDALYGPMTPELPSVWPLSALAWLALALGVLALILACALVLRWWRQQAWRREALQCLERAQQQQNPGDLSRLLRRVARHRLGADIASLGDAAFAQHLSSMDAETALRLSSAGHRLNSTLKASDWQAAKHWIGQC